MHAHLGTSCYTGLLFRKRACPSFPPLDILRLFIGPAHEPRLRGGTVSTICCATIATSIKRLRRLRWAGRRARADKHPAGVDLQGGGGRTDSSPVQVLCCSIPSGEEMVYLDVGGRYVALHMFGGERPRPRSRPPLLMGKLISCL